MPTKSYYGKEGSYLEEHKDYYTEEILKRDVNFIIKSLGLTKKDKYLDLQCAQGRLAIELARRGFDVDGLDFSDHMLRLARAEADHAKLDLDFIKGDINNLQLSRTYTKVAMYFPDWDGVYLDKLLTGIGRIIKKGGMFLFDQDNLFRIWDYFGKNPKAPFFFDALTMELREQGKKIGNRYYVFPELKDKFETAGFKILRAYGGWSITDGDYKYNSP